MSEDVSATMRVGITVILVAALVATVLNLMVMSNSLLTGGQTTLQSGIDAVGQQEFAAYNNTKVSGTQVNTALNLFQGRDVAILIQTKSFKSQIYDNDDGSLKTDLDVARTEDPAGFAYTVRPKQGSGLFMNYGALVSRNPNSSEDTLTICERIAGSVHSAVLDKAVSEASDGEKMCKTIHGSDVNELYCVRATNDPGAYPAEVEQKSGQPYYTALLWDENGIVQTNNNVIGTATLGNPQFLLSSARFQSTLIKDNTGSIIGILFYQIN